MLRITAAAIATCALFLAGCGGSSSSSTVSLSTYVNSLCSAIAPVQKQLVTKVQALAAASVQSPGQGKKAFQDFLSSTSSAANATAAKLKGIGTPSGSNGQEISAEFIRAFTAVSSSFNQAAAAAQSIPTSNRAAFDAGEKRIEAKVQTSLAGLQSSFSALRSPQLQQAVKKEPACAALSGSTG